jgi:RNA 2',3'-cyclic 3'-phosphodiesterase
LSPEIQQRIEQVSNQLKQRLEGVPVRWVPVENIHLTLKFLGDVSVANLEMLTEILQQVVGSHHEFEISAGGLGAFPQTQRPRVLWIGLSTSPELAAIQREIEVETARLGYASEERPFSPHLTLGRVSRNATTNDLHTIAKVLEGYTVGFLGVANVQSVHLFRSDLRPGGSIYTRLFTAPLSGQA